jgi:hypothetical protein
MGNSLRLYKTTVAGTEFKEAAPDERRCRKATQKLSDGKQNRHGARIKFSSRPANSCRRQKDGKLLHYNNWDILARKRERDPENCFSEPSNRRSEFASEQCLFSRQLSYETDTFRGSFPDYAVGPTPSLAPPRRNSIFTAVSPSTGNSGLRPRHSARRRNCGCRLFVNSCWHARH